LEEYAMTVRELIDVLEAYDPDLVVHLYPDVGDEGAMCDIREVDDVYGDVGLFT
jgi:hypothetical protein